MPHRPRWPRRPRRPQPFWLAPLRKAALAGMLAFVAVFLARIWEGDGVGPTLPRAVLAGVVIFAIGFVVWWLMARYLPPNDRWPPRR